MKGGVCEKWYPKGGWNSRQPRMLERWWRQFSLPAWSWSWSWSRFGPGGSGRQGDAEGWPPPSNLTVGAIIGSDQLLTKRASVDRNTG